MTDGQQSGRDAVVIGGGLAGITTALALADAGVRVTLLEGRPRLGGLAFSFQRGEPQTGVAAVTRHHATSSARRSGRLKRSRPRVTR